MLCFRLALSLHCILKEHYIGMKNNSALLNTKHIVDNRYIERKPIEKAWNYSYRGFKACFSNVASLVGLCIIALLLSACSSKKFLKENELTLSSIKVTSDNKQLKTNSYKPFVRQQPNSKWFNLFKVPLGFYCMSKTDTIKGHKGFSKVLKKMGEAPVVFDKSLTYYGKLNLEQALNSQGYLHAKVDTIVKRKGHKAKVTYHLHPEYRFYISRIRHNFDSERMLRVYLQDSTKSLLRQGQPLNLNTLSEERSRIIKTFHDKGYYYLNTDYISFDIDTITGELGAAITIQMRRPAGADTLRTYYPQHFRYVNVFMESTSTDSTSWNKETEKGIAYRDILYHFGEHNPINKRVFVSHISIHADSLYNETALQNTYSNLSALPAINFATVKVAPADDKSNTLDCNIHVRPNKPHNIGLELEGTNTAGNFGAAAALTYSNRNLFKGSELLSFKLRGAYEAITGLEGYNNQSYTEWSAEANLRLPSLLLPFISIDTKRKLKATSEAKLMYDTQDRPEFHRRVLTGAWTYNWNHASNRRWQHRFDLLSINYVYMPWISDTFRKEYLNGDDPHYSVLRYSYENLFIVKTGYSFVYNSLRNASNQAMGLYQTNGFQVKMGIELAGNVLYAFSKATRAQKNTDDNYSIFGIAYSQYAKFDFDFSKSIVINDRNSLAIHTALGIGIPYGNSTILPYEKRYFAGGANSVRGWSVRGLGPGAYKGKDGKIDFVNQTGNLKLDLNAEWRTYLFWKLHGAFFIDAGNVWNTRAYTDMNGAQFKFNSFYKQIAVAYGLGIRLNFNYFILRFDGGMKAIDPAVTSGRMHYPITRPNFSRDFALHFAVGLPF